MRRLHWLMIGRLDEPIWKRSRRNELNDWIGRFLLKRQRLRSPCWLDTRQQMLKICARSTSLSHMRGRSLAVRTLKRVLQPSTNWKRQQPVLLLVVAVVLVAVAVPLAAVVVSFVSPSRPLGRPY